MTAGGLASPREVHLGNPELRALDGRIGQAYAAFLLAMADSELVIGHRHSEWTGFAPSAEEDVAFSSIAQDEMGHAHLYYALITGATDEEAIDRLALDRGAREMRHLPVLHAPNGDWYFTIARHIYWDAWEDVLLSAALQSTLPLLASASQRLLNEEVYHEEHAVQWLELLSSRGPSRGRLQAALKRVVDIGGNPAGRLDGVGDLGREGLLPAAQDLEAAYAGSLLRRLQHVGGWTGGEAANALTNLDAEGPWSSPPGLQLLHRDLTGMRRAHPGATW